MSIRMLDAQLLNFEIHMNGQTNGQSDNACVRQSPPETQYQLFEIICKAPFEIELITGLLR